MRLSFLFSNIDSLLAKLTLALSLFLITYMLYINNLLYLIAGILLLICCASWLIIRRNNPSLQLIWNLNQRTFSILSVIFFIIYSISLTSVAYRSDNYVRPYDYFFLIIIMATILSIQACSRPEGQIRILLCQTIMLGLNLLITQIIIYPSVLGSDPWYHQSFTREIIQSGFIPKDSLYSLLPIFHIDIASTSLLVDIDYRFVSIIAISIPQIIIITLLIYKIGSMLINIQTGLVASIFAIFSNYNFIMTYWLIPNTLGIIFIIILIFLLIKTESIKSIRFTCLIILIMLILVMTHTIASVCMAIIFIVWIISTKFFSKRIATMNKPSITFGLVILFFAIMLSWWIYASGSISKVSELIKWGFNIDFFTPASNYYDAFFNNYIASIPMEERLFSNIGIYIFLIPSIVGYLYILSCKKARLSHYSFALAGLVLIVIPFTAIYLGLFVIQERWFAIAQLMSAIPFTILIFLIVNRLKGWNAQIAMISGVTFLIVCLMIMSPVANMDSPLLSTNTSVRSAYSISELQAASFLAEKVEGNISSDFDYATRSTSVLKTEYGFTRNNVISLDDSLLNGRLFKDGSIIIIRDEITKHPFNILGQPYKLDYDIYKELLDSNFFRVYQNKMVSMYN